jgi:hypothetical protein
VSLTDQIGTELVAARRRVELLEQMQVMAQQLHHEPKPTKPEADPMANRRRGQNGKGDLRSRHDGSLDGRIIQTLTLQPRQVEGLATALDESVETVSARVAGLLEEGEIERCPGRGRPRYRRV